jgi:hypothetical protein
MSIPLSAFDAVTGITGDAGGDPAFLLCEEGGARSNRQSSSAASTVLLGTGPARLRNGRPIYRTRRGFPDGTEDGAVAAFLDIEPRRRSDPRGEHINVAAGVPHDGDGVGMIPGRKQRTRALQKRLPRTGDDKLAATPGFKPAIAQGNRRDHDGVAMRAIKARGITHGAKQCPCWIAAHILMPLVGKHAQKHGTPIDRSGFIFEGATTD